MEFIITTLTKYERVFNFEIFDKGLYICYSKRLSYIIVTKLRKNTLYQGLWVYTKKLNNKSDQQRIMCRYSRK